MPEIVAFTIGTVAGALAGPSPLAIILASGGATLTAYCLALIARGWRRG